MDYHLRKWDTDDLRYKHKIKAQTDWMKQNYLLTY